MYSIRLRADVQAGRGICHGKPERIKVLYVLFSLFFFSGKRRLTVPEVLLAAFQRRYGGRREHSARGEIS